MNIAPPRRGLSRGSLTLVVVAIVLGMVLFSCITVVFLSTVFFGPPLDTLRTQAQAARSKMILRVIEHALTEAWRDESLEVQSLQDLVDAGLLAADFTHSPFGSAPDGGEDYWILFDRPRADEIDDPDSFIVSYDRAAYALHTFVPVCLLGGECDLIAVGDLEALLRNPVNAGRDFDLPARLPESPRPPNGRRP